MTLTATGGDLNVIGSQNVALAAANNVNILSQQENHSLQSNNKNASGGIGVQIGSDGVGFYPQASAGKGSANGNGATHAESLINASDTLTLVSGNDTTIKGAQFTGNTVIGAYNASKADKILSFLQDRDAVSDPTQRQEMVLTLQNHIVDPVGRLIGGNPARGGTIPEGSTTLLEMIRAGMGQQNTSHNCYGASAPSACGDFWG